MTPSPDPERQVRRLTNDVDSIYEVLDRVETTLTGHGRQLADHGRQLVNHGRRLTVIDRRLDSIDGRLETLGGQMTTVLELLRARWFGGFERGHPAGILRARELSDGAAGAPAVATSRAGVRPH
jgi:hypothetical protein